MEKETREEKCCSCCGALESEKGKISSRDGKRHLIGELCRPCARRKHLYGDPIKKTKGDKKCSYCGVLESEKGKLNRHGNRCLIKGLCVACYQRFRATGSCEKKERSKDRCCSNCGREESLFGHLASNRRYLIKGLCDACYQRFCKTGSCDKKERSIVNSCSNCGRDIAIYGQLDSVNKKKYAVKGMCSRCAQRLSKKGSPNAAVKFLRGCFPVSLQNKYWRMMDRCYNSNIPKYKDYGARGITVCDEWLGDQGRQAFYKWAMEVGYRKGLTLDRINVNGNYSPDNCRFVGLHVQANNCQKKNQLFRGVQMRKGKMGNTYTASLIVDGKIYRKTHKTLEGAILWRQTAEAMLLPQETVYQLNNGYKTGV